MPAAGFGKIAFAQTVVTIYFVIITDFGLRTLGARNIARNNDMSSYYLANIVSIRLILSIISFGLLAAVTFFINKDYTTKLLLMLYGLSIFSSSLMFEWVFQGLEDMKHMALAQVLNKFLYMLIIVLFVRSMNTISLVPIAWFAGTLFASVYLLAAYKRMKKPRFRVDIKIWKELFIESLPMGASFIMLTIFHSFDLVMLGIMKSDEYVGWYNAAARIILLLLGIAAILCRVIFPVLARFYKEAISKLEFSIKTIYKYLFAVACPLGVGGLILARPIILILFGDKYINAVIVFQILIWSVVFAFMRITYSESALACDKQKVYMKGVALGVIMNIALNTLLIPKFDIRGAAFATAVSDLTFLSFLIFNFKMFSKKFILQYLPKPVIASALMGGILYGMRSVNVFASIGCGIVVYTALLFFLGYFQKEEIKFLSDKIFKKG